MKLALIVAAIFTSLTSMTFAQSKGSDPIIWAAGPLEVRLAFAEPADPALVRRLTGHEIRFGEGEQAGTLRISAARLADDGRTLILDTDPHPWEATYHLTLPDTRPQGADAALDRHLSYTLSGVEASWQSDQGDAPPAWSGWWPSFDTEALKSLAATSVDHQRAVGLLAKPGRWTLRALVRLPGGKSSVNLETNASFEASFNGALANAGRTGEGLHRATLTEESNGDPVDLSITLTTGSGGKPARLRATGDIEGARNQSLDRSRLIPLWAQPPLPTPPDLAEPPFPLIGGDPARGETAFFSNEARCSACHKIGGRGNDVGPALDALNGRDRARIYRDVADPSAEIHPAYLPYTVMLKDGGVSVGIVRADGRDAIRVIDTDAKTTTIKKAEIDDLRPSGTSIMPVGLAGALGEQTMRDLIAYLTAPKAAETPKARK